MKKNSLKVAQYRIRVKQKLIDYKGGKCQKCGYDKKIPSVYHFHHRIPTEKEIAISGSTLGFKRLKAEVDKCDLLCANCHLELHDAAWSEQRKKAFVLKRHPRKERSCLGCQLLFLPKRKEQKYCCIQCSPTTFRSNGVEVQVLPSEL